MRDAILALRQLDEQIPNPYRKGQWYPATMLDGKTCEVRRTMPGRLRVRRPFVQHVKTPTGEVLSSRVVNREFACDCSTGQVKEL